MPRLYGSNESIILNYIRRYGPISKASIARQTGITAPTVTNVCSGLLSRGLIYEEGRGQADLGRPSTLLQFNQSIEKYLIIHVRTQQIHFYVVNGGGEQLDTQIIPTVGLDGDEILATLYKGMDAYLKDASFDINAIGLILRGPVDSVKGVSIYSPHAKWSNVPLRYILEERYHLPVYMENDMHALTIGEYCFGKGLDASNLVVVKLGYGIGATLVVHGELYRGFRDGAGELGHNILVIENNETKTLEEVASETAIRNYVAEAIANGAESSLKNHPELFTPRFKVQPVYEAAVEGDAVAMAAVKKAGKYLGIAISNLVNLCNPERIVISSNLNGASTIIDSIIQESIQTNTYWIHPVEVVYSGKGHEQALRGMVDIICKQRATSEWLH